MPLTPIPEEDLGRGIDAFHPENKVPAGFLEDARNMDPTAEGTLRKRVGFQLHAGFLPFRVLSLTRTSNVLYVETDLPSGVMDNLRGSPFIVSGRPETAIPGYPAGEVNSQYFLTFTVSGPFLLTPSVGGDIATTRFEGCVYGIDPSGLDFSANGDVTNPAYSLHVDHMDHFENRSYRHPVCGFRGVFYAGRPSSDTVTSDYMLPTSYAAIHATMSSTVVVAPLFWGTGDAPGRTRGYVTSDDGATNWLRGISASFNASTGYVEFLISVPGMVVSGTLASTVTVGSDRVTIREASHSALNGEFVLRSISSPAANQILITASVPGVTFVDDASLPDLLTAGFSAGVFTDRLPVSGRGFAGATASDPAGVVNIAPSIWTVVDSASGAIFVSGVDVPVTMPSARVVAQAWTTTALPVSSAPSMPETTGWIRGATLSATGLPSTRRIRVTNVFPVGSSGSLTVTGDGTTATLTSSTYAPYFSAGDRLLLSNSTDLAGVHDVLDAGATTVTFASSFVGTTTAVIVGDYIGLSEEIEAFGDNGATAWTASVAERWIAIEAPPRPLTTSPNQTYSRYYTLSDTDGPFPKFRSVMVGESMYIGNGNDIVFKYDGLSVSSAGLPRWSPLFGICQVSDRLTGIVNHDRARPVEDATAPAGGAYTMHVAGDAADLVAGDRVTYTRRDPTDNHRYEYGYVVNSTDAATTDAAGTSSVLRVSPVATPAFGAADDYITKTISRRYMLATYRTDVNGRVTVTSPYSINDAVVNIGWDHRVDLLVNQTPLYSLFDWRKVETHFAISIGTDATPTFTFANITPVDYTSRVPARVFQDGIQVEEAALRGASTKNTALAVFNNLFSSDTGPAYKASLERPPRGKCMTNVASCLIVGNINTHPPTAITALIPAGASARPSDLIGQSVTFVDQDTGLTRGFSFRAANMGGMGTSNNVFAGVLRVTDMDGTFITLTATSTFTVLGAAGVAAGVWCQIFSKTDTRISSFVDAFLLGWFKVASVTGDQVITIAAPHRAKRQVTSVDTGTDTLTLTNHGLTDGDPIRLTGSVPAGSSASTQYYARVISPSTFRLFDTFEHAIDTTSSTGLVNLTSSGGTFYLMYVEQPVALSIAFAEPVSSIVTPVVILSPTTNGSSTTNDVDHRHKTSADEIPTADAMVALTLRELGRAVNAVAAQDSFVPISGVTQAPSFYCASVGNDADTPNTVEVESFTASSFTTAVFFGAATAPQWFVDGAAVTSSAATPATVLAFPSRIAKSFRNFPEVFDQPFIQDSRFSASAIDVGEDNGDEVTAVIPRFGESFSNAALGQGACLVSKNRSMYLVDVNTKSVAQLETNGQGTTFPRSICFTKNGIEFANHAGLWKINDENKCIFLGKIMKRYWERAVNRDESLTADVICGHHDKDRNRTMTSVPLLGDTNTSEVLVYDHTKENSDDIGPFTIYNNFDVTGWTNAGSDSLFGTTGGKVFALRRAQDDSDYQDDADPVGGYDVSGVARGAYAILGDRDFGADGIRKRVTYANITFRTDSGSSVSSADPIVVSVAVDHSHAFASLDEFTLADPGAGDTDSLSGIARGSVTTLQFSLTVPKAQYHQLKFFDDTVMRPVEVAGVTFLVEALNPAGVPTAGTTR